MTIGSIGSFGVRARLLVGLVLLASVGGGIWWWRGELLPRPGSLRIGYRHTPPFYFAPNGQPPAGLAVEVVSAAAARLGTPVQWTRIQGPSEDRLRAGEIDIWPTSPEAAAGAGVYVTEPWLESSFFLVARRDRQVSTTGTGVGRRVAVIPVRHADALFERVLQGATLTRFTEAAEALQAACAGSVDAALLEGRQVQGFLLHRPAGCDGANLSIAPLPEAMVSYGVGAASRAVRQADALRAEITRMGQDGTLAEIHARWSLTTASETRMVYDLQQARQRTRWSLLGLAGISVALGISLWQLLRIRHARHLAEQATRTMEDYARQQERYRLLFERNLAGVFRATIDGRILECNDAFARMLGHDAPADVIATPAWQFYAEPADRAAFVARILESGGATNIESRIRRKDGSTGWLLENVSLLDRGRGEPGIIEGTALDVTEQRRLEEQYRQAQQLESIGRLAGGVAHDFNNLLTAINGYAELVAAGLQASSPLRDSVDEIRRAGQRAALLTQQLLAFSRQQVLRPKILSLNDVVCDARQTVERTLGSGIELRTHLDPDLGLIRADARQLEQVLVDLASNARDAMSAGGRLVVETLNMEVAPSRDGEDPEAPTGHCVRLRVTDTGEGMDEETLRRVFEPFFTTRDIGKGTGLGLSTVYGIVKQSGGHIRVESAPGEGTTFEVTFPRVDGTAQEVGHRASPSGHGRQTVLVVENRLDVRHLAMEVLTQHGYRVLAAEDARGAISLCRRASAAVRLAVVDLSVPGTNGTSLAALLTREWPGIKVLHLCGADAKDVDAGEAQQGQAACLRRPFTPLELLTRVEEILKD